MFKFLKDKLKGVVDKFSQTVEEEAPEETVEQEVEVEEPKVEKEAPKVEKEEPEEESPEEKEEEPEPAEEPKEPVEEPEPEVEEEPEPVEEPEEKEAEPEPEVKEEPKPVEEPVAEEKPEEKKGFFSKVFKKEQVEEKVEAKPEVEEEKKGFLGKIKQSITTKKISEEKFEELFWELELALLENNVAVEVIEKIKADLKGELVDKPIPRSQINETIAGSLSTSINSLFDVPGINLLEKVKEKKPLVICFVGINGSGKTTSISKVAKYLQDNNLSVVMAAADTFRAAAIDQLQLHADNLDIKLIKHDYGSDPAAVAFDAVKHAEASKKDVVLIDTAGRLHSNINLMDEMRKIIRVANPDLKIFVGESITGNDCVEQAKKFDETVGIDGIILSKADVDEKGGAAISVSYVTKKPILFLGVGQEYTDLQPFDKAKLLESIGL
jgi:fused signal recognition particle receptor